MNWSFGDDADLERELVDRIMIDRARDLGYALDVEFFNGHTIVDSNGQPLDTTVVHPLMLRSIDYDGWAMTFDVLDANYEQTDVRVVATPDSIYHIHIC